MRLLNTIEARHSMKRHCGTCVHYKTLTKWKGSGMNKRAEEYLGCAYTGKPRMPGDMANCLGWKPKKEEEINEQHKHGQPGH